MVTRQHKNMFLVSMVLAASLLTTGLTVLADNLSDAQSLIGTQAKPFTLKDADGKTHSLAEYKGKFVVLEWTNFGCPFVHAQYSSKAMQKLQAEYTAKGVKWLTIASSAPDRQGYFSGKKLKEEISEEGVKSTAYLVDPTGQVGKLYKAKSTPDLFLINPQGKIVYAGAVDDNPTTDASEVPHSNSYIKAALDEAMHGQKVKVAATKSYGCSIKYAE